MACSLKTRGRTYRETERCEFAVIWYKYAENRIFLCPYGGTGRRGRFKIYFLWSVGSNPTLGTNTFSLIFYKKIVIIFIESKKRRLFFMRRKAEPVVLTAYDEAVKEFHNATAAYRSAQVNFQNAVPEFFDIANRELTLAQARVDMAMQRVRLLSKG